MCRAKFAAADAFVCLFQMVLLIGYCLFSNSRSTDFKDFIHGTFIK